MCVFYVLCIYSCRWDAQSRSLDGVDDSYDAMYVVCVCMCVYFMFYVYTRVDGTRSRVPWMVWMIPMLVCMWCVCMCVYILCCIYARVQSV